MKIDKKEFLAGLVSGIVTPLAIGADFNQYHRLFSLLSKTKSTMGKYDESNQLADDFFSVDNDLSNAIESYAHSQKE